MELPTLQIKDNFLSTKEFNIICNNLDKIPYTALKNTEGNFGFRYDFKHNKENDWLFKKIKKQFFPEVTFKISQPSYHWRHNTNKVFSHVDKKTDYNFLLYLKGTEIVYNGTGFYQAIITDDNGLSTTVTLTITQDDLDLITNPFIT